MNDCCTAITIRLPVGQEKAQAITPLTNKGRKEKAYATQAVTLHIGANVRKTSLPALVGQQAQMGTYRSPVPGCLKVGELALQ